MNDLIKREDAIKALTEVLFDEPPYLNSIEKCEAFARKTLESIPLVEPTIEIDADQLAKLLREGWTIHSEPKQGEWLFKEITDDYHITGLCSACKERRRIDNFCPNCGARMKGADDETD